MLFQYQALIVFLWVLLSIAIGIIGSKREIGFYGGFILAVLLSPLIGLFATLASDISNKQQKQTPIEANKYSSDDHWPPH